MSFKWRGDVKMVVLAARHSMWRNTPEQAQRQHRVGCIQRFKSSFTRLGWFQTVLPCRSPVLVKCLGHRGRMRGNSWERRKDVIEGTKPGEHFSLAWYKERVCRRQEEAEACRTSHEKPEEHFRKRVWLLADGAERSGKLRAWSLGPGLEARKRLVRSAQQCGGRESQAARVSKVTVERNWRQ